MPPPQQRRHPASRPGGRTARVTERVLVTALQLMGEYGVEALQYDELAARSGVGRATIYRRWPNREDLVYDALQQFARRALPLSRSEDIVSDLVDFVSAVAEAAQTPEGKVVMHVASSSGMSPRLRAVGLRLLSERLVDLQDRVSAAVVAGQLPEVDAGLLNHLLIGPVHLHLMRESRPFTRQDAVLIVAVVVAGLRATAPGNAAS